MTQPYRVAWLSGCLGVLLTVCGAASPAAAATIDVFIPSDGAVATEVAPFDCVRLVNLRITLSNQDDVDQPTTLMVTLPPMLAAIPGSCSATIGMCDIQNASLVTWSGTIPAGQQAVVEFTAVVDGAVLPDAKLCVDVKAQFGSMAPIMEQVCFAPGTCGVQAPAVSRSFLSILAFLLALAGSRVLLRRKSVRVGLGGYPRA